MRKEKEKRSLNNPLSFQYLLDEYVLFVRHFEIQSPLTLEEVRQNLEWLQTPESSGCLNRQDMRIKSYVTTNQTDQGFFTLDLERYHSSKNSHGYRLSARAEGEITVTEDETILSGRVTVAGIRFWAGVIFMAVVFSLFSIFTEFTNFYGFLFPVLAVIMAFSWYRMYSDRNLLLRRIESAAVNSLFDSLQEQDAHSHLQEEKFKREAY